jgi:hypothetical protein
MGDMIGGCRVQPCLGGLDWDDEETRVIAAGRPKAIHHPVALGLLELIRADIIPHCRAFLQDSREGSSLFLLF